ncbi:alpha/beta fold hydrolase [Allopusillimonas ginsengisoli]|nr:alpha/beta fold hydrolase [Allopusillimonas ginsengisoli]
MTVVHHTLSAGDGHSIHITTAGSPDGIPIVSFHGGPGSGSNASMMRPFDLSRFFVVLIDQRGSGRSSPSGRIARNSTSWLLRDVEAVRAHLGISRWYVLGGSWGATLAIAYSGSHPEAVSGLILRGTFLASGQEVRGLLSASRTRAPRAWLDLYRASGADRPSAMMSAMYARLRQGGPTAWRVAQAYSALERAMLARCNRHMSSRTRRQNTLQQRRQAAKYLIQVHYLWNACGLRGGRLAQLAAQAHAHGIVGTAVHGKRDPVCPLANLAWLKTHMPNIKQICVNAGHLATDPPIYAALVSVLDEIARQHARNVT